jgi:hypothetical protein
MLKRALILIAFATPLAADVTSPSGKTVDCFCTDKGGARVELGENRCLEVGGRVFMARCEMSLNVPMWRETGQSCVTG